MRIVFLIICLIFGLNATSQSINWVTIDEALELQKQNPKKIIIDMYTNWCGPCKMFDRITFKNQDVVDYINTNYYAVKFNAEGNEIVNFNGLELTNPNYDPKLANRRNGRHQFTAYLRVSAYPTLIFLGESGEYLAPVPGFQKPQQLELYLKLFNSDKYKEMTSQELFNAYYSSFKPEFTP